MLWLYQRTFYGTTKTPANANMQDVSLRERSVLWPLAVTALVMGVVPSLWMNSIDRSVGHVLETQQPVAASAQASLAQPTPVQLNTVLK